MNEMIRATLTDGRDHDFSLFYTEINIGITFFICSKRNFRSNLRMDGYRKIKIYQTKAQEWITIFIDINHDGSYSTDFKISKENWKFNPQMEKILKDLSMNKIELK